MLGVHISCIDNVTRKHLISGVSAFKENHLQTLQHSCIFIL